MADNVLESQQPIQQQEQQQDERVPFFPNVLYLSIFALIFLVMEVLGVAGAILKKQDLMSIYGSDNLPVSIVIITYWSIRVQTLLELMGRYKGSRKREVPVGRYLKHGVELGVLAAVALVKWRGLSELYVMPALLGFVGDFHVSFQVMRQYQAHDLGFSDWALDTLMVVALYGFRNDNRNLVVALVACLGIVLGRFYSYNCGQIDDRLQGTETATTSSIEIVPPRHGDTIC